MVESQQVSFISTDDLATLMGSEGDKLRILDCSTKMGAGPDPALEFTKNRIKGAKFLDLTLVRDLNQPYPFMMPS